MPKKSREEFKTNAKVYRFNCVQCALTFYTNQPKTRFCSSTCRNYHWRDNRELAPLPNELFSSNKILSDEEIDALIKEVESLNLLIDWAQELDEKIKELKNMRQQLLGYIEEELLIKMRFQGTNTIGTNILPLLELMEIKHASLSDYVHRLLKSRIYLPVITNQ